ARAGIVMQDRDWDLTVRNGVLTGDISVGCGVRTIQCHETIKLANEVLNKSPNIDIRITWHDPSGWFSGKPDVELRFPDTLPRNAAAQYTHESRLLEFIPPYHTNEAIVTHEFGHVLGIS